MLTSTLEVIRAGLKADPTITPMERAIILTMLRQRPDVTKAASPAPKPPRLMRRAEAARMCSRSPRWIDRMAKEGVLKKRYIPGRRRAAGFLESDVTALISGGCA